MKRRLLFVLKWPLNQRNYERFGLKYFADRGHEIIVLDVLKPCHPRIHYPPTPLVQDPRLTFIKIDQWSELAQHESLFASCDLVFFPIHARFFSIITLPLLRLMQKYRLPYLIFGSVIPMPIPTFQELSWKQKLTQFFGRLRTVSPLSSLLARVPMRWLNLPMAAIAVLPSTFGGKDNALIGPDTIVVPSHTPDYARCLEHKAAGVQTQGHPYAVFIDQFLPFHQDNNLVRYPVRVDPEAYYQKLRRLFARIESELGMEVIVAAHPTADYDAHPGLLGHHRRITGKTMELVANARLVIGHYSTALGYAAVFRRPILQLAVTELYEHQPAIREAFNSLRDLLKLRLRFLDDADHMDLSDGFDIDETAYGRYVDNFLRHPQSTDRPYWDVVAEAVEALPRNEKKAVS